MDVTVDDNFARFGAKSYAINKINSVEVRVRQPHGTSGAVICGLLAAWGAVTFVQSYSRPEGSSPGGLFVLIVFGALAFWLWKKSKVREYQLFLMTSSSEAQAIVSNDPDYVNRLRSEIEEAMLIHSRRGSDR